MSLDKYKQRRQAKPFNPEIEANRPQLKTRDPYKSEWMTPARICIWGGVIIFASVVLYTVYSGVPKAMLNRQARTIAERKYGDKLYPLDKDEEKIYCKDLGCSNLKKATKRQLEKFIEDNQEFDTESRQFRLKKDPITPTHPYSQKYLRSIRVCASF